MKKHAVEIVTGKENVNVVTPTLCHYLWKSDCGKHKFSVSAPNAEKARDKLHRHFDPLHILPRISNQS